MNQVKGDMTKIEFQYEDFQHPIAYAFMYVQWEANTVGIVTIWLVTMLISLAV